MTVLAQSGEAGGGLGPLVDFYSKLPKGHASPPGGLKGRYFSGKNASAKPILVLFAGIWLVGYTLDYNRAWFRVLPSGLVLIKFLLYLVHLSTSILSPYLSEKCILTCS